MNVFKNFATSEAAAHRGQPKSGGKDSEAGAKIPSVINIL